MARGKLKKFAQMREWPHCFEAGEALPLGERVILELACGHGYYTLELARRLPEATVIGVDIKGARMWHGAKEALGMGNALFLRTRIEDLDLPAGSVDEIWITFPDPQPRKVAKRLMSPRFLEIYSRVLKPGGVIHLKTDDTEFFEFALQMAEPEFVDWDVHAGNDPLLTSVQTFYERKFILAGKRIKYARFRILSD